ncbi:hypothetical protein TNCV_3252201 [Trichonephila clavipes]|nr:hypothetical protein TNCV_3252201 [Trichonephila clavipes]
MYKNALKEDLIRVVEELDDERVSQNEREVTSEQKIELAKLQLAKLEKEIELQLAKNKALSLNPAAKVEEKQFETNIENMIKILLWSPWKYRCGQRTVRMAVMACSQNQAVFARRRSELKLKLELVEEKQKLLNIREKKRRTREVREQALPSEYHQEFSTVIEDDDNTNVDTGKELSLEQKLELMITKKISTNQNTIQKSALSKTIRREIHLFEDERSFIWDNGLRNFEPRSSDVVETSPNFYTASMIIPFLCTRASLNIEGSCHLTSPRQSMTVIKPNEPEFPSVFRGVRKKPPSFHNYEVERGVCRKTPKRTVVLPPHSQITYSEH